MAVARATSHARRCPTPHAHDRQTSPLSRRTPLPMVVHLQGEAKALAGMRSSPTVPTIRHKQAIIQLPDLGLSMTIDRVAQPFKMKLSELSAEQLAKLQFWIKLVWRDR